MNKRFVRSIVVASVVVAGVVVSSAEVSQTPEEAVRQANAQEVEAFVHNDPGAMARLWSDDFVLPTG